MDYQKYLERYEKEKLDSLKRQDAIKYFRACNALGLSPTDVEDRILYERGRFEIERGINLENIASLDVKEEDITGFLREARDFPINNFSSYAEEKGDLLKKYFLRFRPCGSQDLKRYEDIQVGAIFSRLVNYYSKKY